MSKSFELITGAAGSGKTLALTGRILQTLKNGETVYLIVPEQEVMVAERRIADAADAATPPISCEELNVLSFRRLANLAFRTYGGITYYPPTEGAKSVIMWQTMEELGPLLKHYTGKRDNVMVETMLSAVGELKRSGITPGALELAIKKLENGESLQNKLHDLSLLLAHYNNMMLGSYSDPSDDVNRLATLLETHRMLEGCHVYLDSFNGFTGAESAVLYHMMSQAVSVTVALCLPDDPPPTGFETVKNTALQLKKLCDTLGIPQENRKHSTCNRTAEFCKSPFLKLEETMRTLNGDVTKISRPSQDELNALPFVNAIRAVRPTDSFAEAEYAAMRIKSLVDQGARYKDIAVVARGIDRYKGIIDSSLSRFGIPYFVSDRRPVSETPLFRVIMRALAVLDGKWKAEDMLSYLKTGMTPLNIDQLYELEKYITAWNISDNGWESDNEWTMNPGGYTDSMTKSDSDTLDRLNELRMTVRDPLIRLNEQFSTAKNGVITLAKGCAAVYGLITALGIPERITESESEEDATLYNTVIDMLDMLVGVGGDIPVNVGMLSGILAMAAGKTDYGAIPETMDTVTVGDAALLRAGSVKHVILLGCIDSVFPRAVADDSFFSDAEKEKLAELGIPTSPGTELMSDDECFYFYRSASAATETAAFSCPMQDTAGDEYQPSVGFIRIQAFLGYDPENKIYPPKYPEDFPPESRAYSVANAAELYRANENTVFGESLKKALTDTVGSSFITNSTPISDPVETVSKEHTNKLFGNDIAMTQYRIESFSKCPFQYYAGYVLKLDKPTRASFSSADIGNFIHRIMEKAVGELFDDNGLKPDAKSRNINKLVDDAVNEVVFGMLGNHSSLTARMNALIRRLNRTSVLLIRSMIEEFEGSRFVPRAFELDINNEKGVPPFSVPLHDGKSIHVYGKIDRVDTYKKGDDLYVRVVDYKTGTREHSLKNIEKGIDLQMLLYLFAIWKADKTRLPKEFGNIEGKVYPAAAIYQDSAYPTVNREDLPKNDEEAISSALAALGKTGLILNDPEILEAMEEKIGKGTPRMEKIDRQGNSTVSVNSGSMLLTLGEIGALADKIAAILTDIGGKLRSGNANAAPAKLANDSPCKFCDFRTFCRSADCSK